MTSPSWASSCRLSSQKHCQSASCSEIVVFTQSGKQKRHLAARAYGTEQASLKNAPFLWRTHHGKRLARFGLGVREWAGQYVVSDGKGRSEVAEDLAGLWAAAERLAGRPLDPLDPVLLDAL